MDDVLHQAEELGAALAATARFTRYAAARDAFLADREGQRMLEDFERQYQLVQRALAERRPVEVEDKRRLEALRAAVELNAVVREFQRAQAEFMDLMIQVQERIQQPLGLNDGGK